MRECLTPVPVVRVSLNSGLFGGVIGAVLSGLVNDAFVAVPDSAVNHALTGLASGFASAFFGLLPAGRFRRSCRCQGRCRV
ncbi:hypothetical protein [Streptomyces coffeae]|uniref:Uncharacterized protein n=1 Tax=Streptomyces coffeae TaxID=621382 RepID=A0ABS1NP41_9ACTN|nr:hypothetical protein [Streptomyces coffeae]MBL1101501.1 hypothetical protein [Streptomyces coffeae]